MSERTTETILKKMEQGALDVTLFKDGHAMFNGTVDYPFSFSFFLHLTPEETQILYRALYDQLGLPEEPNRDSTEP